MGKIIVKCKKRLFFLLFLFFLIFFLPVQAEEARVIAVYDGDTIKVRFKKGNTEVVRLIGINTPEISDSREKVQLIALMAKRFTYYCLLGEKVKLSYDWEKRDKYGRLLAYVFFNTQLFNEYILKRGFAYIFLKYPFCNDYRKRFIKAFRNAKKSEIGFWKEQPYPVISPKETQDFIGCLMRVRFVCSHIQEKGKLIFLYASGFRFAVIIYLRDKHYFSDIQGLIGSEITVSGFVEEYKGKPQMAIFRPAQIKKMGTKTLVSLSPFLPIF